MSTGWSQKQVPCAHILRAVSLSFAQWQQAQLEQFWCLVPELVMGAVCQFYFPHRPQGPLNWKKPTPLSQPREQQRLRGCSSRSCEQLQICICLLKESQKEGTTITPQTKQSCFQANKFLPLEELQGQTTHTGSRLFF